MIKRMARAFACVAGGGFLMTGACLPENYFARTGRVISVTFMDMFIQTLVAPIFSIFPDSDETMVP
jgi:hypothetical protein